MFRQDRRGVEPETSAGFRVWLFVVIRFEGLRFGVGIEDLRWKVEVLGFGI
jgi:hypothetical protein